MAVTPVTSVSRAQKVPRLGEQIGGLIAVESQEKKRDESLASCLSLCPLSTSFSFPRTNQADRLLNQIKERQIKER